MNSNHFGPYVYLHQKETLNRATTATILYKTLFTEKHHVYSENKIYISISKYSSSAIIQLLQSKVIPP